MQDSTPPNDERTEPPSFLTRFIATGFYSGYVPWASGTFGSLVGALIYFLPGIDNPFVLYPLTAAGFVLGAFASWEVAEFEGHKLTRTAEIAKAAFQKGEHATPDPSIVVIDEIVGMFVSLAFVEKSLAAVFIAFVAFRFFDIVKPFPARQCERFPNGWGIMLDDVVAGVYANITTHLLLHWGVLS